MPSPDASPVVDRPPSPAEGAQPLNLSERPNSLTEVVYDAIRQGIIDKRLAPGSRVTEAGLAEQLGVSKTPVREALLRLREAGVIEPHGRRGGRVVRPSQTAIRHAFEAREALESYAAGRAAELANYGQITTLIEAATRGLARARANDAEGFVNEDALFHGLIGQSARNPVLARMIRDALTLALTLRQRDRPLATASMLCADAHMRIAEAIAHREAAVAEDEMRSHIRFVLAVVLDREGAPAPEVAV